MGVSATRGALAIAVCAQAAGAAGGNSSDVPEQLPVQLPGPGFPGLTPEASHASWPSGRQPQRLQAWPQSYDSDGKRTLHSCWKKYVLQDTATGWPGKCLKLFHAEQLDSAGAKACKDICHAEARCPVWQYVNATSKGPLSPGQCWVGFGEDCIYRGGKPDSITVEGAQRIMHGEVKVLMNLTGWKINNLYNIGMFHEGNVDVSILRCKAYCYSSIYCEYWQYGDGGCWVDNMFYTTARGTVPENRVQYPLTLNGGADNTSQEAHSMIAGEYIQHYCPPIGADEEEQPTATPKVEVMPMLGGGGPQSPEQGVLQGGFPWWAWAALACAVTVCLAVCAFVCIQQSRGKKGRATRAARNMDSDFGEDSPLMDNGKSSRSFAESEGSDDYDDDDDFDAVPPAPDWQPPAASAAQPSLGSGGEAQAGRAGIIGGQWSPLGASGRSHAQLGASTQRLDLLPQPPPPMQMMSPYRHAPAAYHHPGTSMSVPHSAYGAYGYPPRWG